MNGGVDSINKHLKGDGDRLRHILRKKISDEKEKELLFKFGIAKGLHDNETLYNAVLVDSAIKGNISAIKYIDERIGMNPAMQLKQKRDLREDTEANASASALGTLSEFLCEIRKMADDIQ